MRFTVTGVILNKRLFHQDGKADRKVYTVMVDRTNSIEKDTITVYSDNDYEPGAKQTLYLDCFIKAASDETKLTEVKK